MPFRIYKQALQVAINKLDVAGLFISHLQGLQQIDYNYMAFCLTNHVTDMHDIRTLLHERLLAIGRENYQWLVNKGPYEKYPDHAPSSVSLAYAIEHNELTAAEVAGIVFDHADTAETFMAVERKKFLDVIIQQLADGMNNQKGSP